MIAPTGWITTNHMPLCASTISSIRIELARMILTTKERPSASSYESICAEERNPPRIAYLLFDAQPASTIPYTAMEAIDIKYNTPTLISAIYNSISRPNKLIEVPQGITAAIIIEGTIVIIGAQKKRILSAFAGTSSSLKINLIASAIG